MKPLGSWRWRRKLGLVAAGCAVLVLSTSCGDFSLFGNGGDGGNGGNGDAETICAWPFSVLEDYTGFSLLSSDGALENPIALAVVPPGMTFEFASRTVEPGDVLVADRGKGKIFVYPQGGTPFEMITVQAPAGLALFSWSSEGSGAEPFQLLYYSSATRNSFYIYDLAGTLFPAGQPSIEVTNTLLGTTILREPTSLAVHGDENEVSLFVLNQNNGLLNAQTIVRIKVTLTATPSFFTSTLAQRFSSLRDMAYRSAADQLFFSQNDLADPDVPRIFRISNATADAPPVLDGTALPPPLIEDPLVLINPFGLALPFTDTQGGQSALLTVQPLIQFLAFLQYDPSTGVWESYLTGPDPSLDQPKAIAYDCTNRRILFTNIPENQAFFSSTLWEIRR